jgi:endo-1,3(4)-beta-glucanase
MCETGNLMLAIQARTFSNYYYMSSTNTNHPARFVGNKVAGILFENKVHYTSTFNTHPSQLPPLYWHLLFIWRRATLITDFAIAYFGSSPPLIHGIHMLPISPATAYLRPRAFVKEEWEKFFDNGRAVAVEGGWRGILHANLALIDPRASYMFFRDGVNGFWDERWIDGGASRTWYLVWAAGLGEVMRR